MPRPFAPSAFQASDEPTTSRTIHFACCPASGAASCASALEPALSGCGAGNPLSHADAAARAPWLAHHHPGHTAGRAGVERHRFPRHAFQSGLDFPARPHSAVCVLRPVLGARVLLKKSHALDAGHARQRAAHLQFDAELAAMGRLAPSGLCTLSDHPAGAAVFEFSRLPDLALLHHRHLRHGAVTGGAGSVLPA